ncbi:hypothetical protein EXIGLDRAFT_251114 [Exidia glandulosa HHB12029]|uniref:Ricin B lectin domain-containing protein n=1 Tax=Exidia glandulosa HHB12029 TaxID=1314781 RepID=A0A165MHT2_EXIGL|nr:hypothetical protein EXIGLDRAFT_251114 [Exidia glandulosa HHB12029]
MMIRTGAATPTGIKQTPIRIPSDLPFHLSAFSQSLRTLSGSSLPLSQPFFTSYFSSSSLDFIAMPSSSALFATVFLAPALVLAQKAISPAGPSVTAQRCIQPQHASMVEGTAIVLGPCAGTPEQAIFTDNSQLRVFSNQCITLPAGAQPGAPLTISTCDAAQPAQQWVYDEAGQTLQNAASGDCMDLSHGSLAIGSVVSFWKCVADAPNQIWSMSTSYLLRRWPSMCRP